MKKYLAIAILLVSLVALGIVYIKNSQFTIIDPAPARQDPGSNAFYNSSNPRQGQPEIGWNITVTGENTGSAPHSLVQLVVDGQERFKQSYDLSCSEIGKNNPDALLAGELSAVQCWWGGGGYEIGVFANENGGLDVMVGELDEGSAYLSGVRGNFKIVVVLR